VGSRDYCIYDTLKTAEILAFLLIYIFEKMLEKLCHIDLRHFAILENVPELRRAFLPSIEVKT
jgi:hypothetical protein